MTRPSVDSPDPLTAAIAPPKDESPEQRTERERQEAEAQRVSDMIDEQIKAEVNAKKRKKPPIKVLLLGQSESGKSTTVKNFQLAYAKNAWLDERASWRSVIHLNLVRSVNTILDAVGREMSHAQSLSQIPIHLPFSSSSASSDDDDDDEDGIARNIALHSLAPPGAMVTADGEIELSPIQHRPIINSQEFLFTEQHRLLLLRLGPLRRVQRNLESRLGAAALDNASDLRGPATPFPDTAAPVSAPLVPAKRPNPTRPREFFVRSRSGWKGALDRGTHIEDETGDGKEESADDVLEVISDCAKDIRALWQDEMVQGVLAKRKIRMEDQPGFSDDDSFLDDAERIASRDYEPSDDDVIRSRLRTMGVQEYKFLFEKGSETGREWMMYDVGGARSCRSAWYPFFEDANAIIFLAPISVFDEPLAEDRKVNRLEDSYLLWKAICSSKLLAKVQLILFLNKCDLLQRKLKRGIEVKRYVPTYGDRPNDLPSVAKYFRQQFAYISKKNSPEPRGFYSFMTSVVVRPSFHIPLTDIQSTAITLGTVREGVLRNHLQEAELI
ncbi:hypothetical protein EW146_g5867 [Bondarzewia mesenterica]|uniref:G-alpha-domain-containing protein n=1 Tax=Bondarzewia mesenterica TaxID=1095465 RepID=A0A4S4LQ61_9AGAM|nr:hypothetical protein EW146_g5867 [Bondarzewia mesenterica]